MDSLDSVIIGNEPPAPGMRIAVRLRRDFTVTDPDRLLAAAREAYISLNPGASRAEAATMVTSAADAIFALLEQDGLLGNDTDHKLAARRSDGLQIGGWRAQVSIDDPWPLLPGPRTDCLTERDVFALPPDIPSHTGRSPSEPGH